MGIYKRCSDKTKFMYFIIKDEKKFIVNLYIMKNI